MAARAISWRSSPSSEHGRAGPGELEHELGGIRSTLPQRRAIAWLAIWFACTLLAASLTWCRPATPLRFVDSEYASMLLADLDAKRPVYIILGSTVPHREFTQLHEFLRKHYRRDHRLRIGRVQFWQLRE